MRGSACVFDHIEVMSVVDCGSRQFVVMKETCVLYIKVCV